MNTLKKQFDRVFGTYEALFLNAPVVKGLSWQSTAAPAETVELFNHTFQMDLEGAEDLDVFQKAIQPNLPWADRHFEEERVSGRPINPGETWKIWPYGHSAKGHLKDKIFDHSYAERYWPKHAALPDSSSPMMGIRFPYGDLDDLVTLLVRDPLTRQAYLPIFFPEDLAAANAPARVPCTLGYHFIRRDDKLHVVYPMRSCDFVRHFRDDVYLTIRLLLWVLEECRKQDPVGWGIVTPGTFRMHITSLHMFVPDRQALVYRKSLEGE